MAIQLQCRKSVFDFLKGINPYVLKKHTPKEFEKFT